MSKREQVIKAVLAANQAAYISLASIQLPRELLASVDRLAGLGERFEAASPFSDWNARQIDQQYNVDKIVSILEGRQAPAVRWQHEPSELPEPEPPKPIAPADWHGLIEQALKVATREQVVKALLDMDAGSQQLPSWDVIEAIALDFEENGHRYKNMGAFGRKHGIKSRTTVSSYLAMYEAKTGKQVRPGQGRAKGQVKAKARKGK